MKPNRVFEQCGYVVEKNAGLGEVRDFANQALEIHLRFSLNALLKSTVNSRQLTAKKHHSIIFPPPVGDRL
jgi:hypothetical protein